MIRTGPRTLMFALLFAILSATCSHAEKNKLPAVRWIANAPGCTVDRDDQGRYRWKMVGDDLELTLLVDSQELAKSRRRFYGVFGVYISANYTGQSKFEFPADVRVTFLRHRNITEAYMDPTEFQTNLQNDVDSYIFETERYIKKHPDKAEEKTTRMREYQKEVAEFIEFLTTQSLQPATLTPGNPVSQGWVFYSTSNRWIGPWKPREDFLLLVWMKDKVWEFPFSLPPSEGDAVLRKRDQ